MTITVTFHAPKRSKKIIAKWRKAIAWWVTRIRENCGIEITIQYAATDSRAIPKKKKFYATDRAKVRKSRLRKTVVGPDALRGLLGDISSSPRDVHICLFKKVIAKTKRSDDASVPGKFEPPNVLVAKRKNTKKQDRRHEVGHVFGLGDGDGGLMDKHPPRPGSSGYYGDMDHWGDDWCEKISTHLGRE